MDPMDLYKRVHRNPFQPVRIHVKDGRAIDITARLMAVVTRDYIDIGVQAPGEPEGICAKVIHVPLSEVSRVEDIGASAAAS
jgi:hypothetical protein